jgi:hypothetical protein
MTLWIVASGLIAPLDERAFPNYIDKDSTGLLKCWVYPPLARLYTALRTDPNVLTAVSVVLVFATVPLWAGGHKLAGFVAVLGPRPARPKP